MSTKLVSEFKLSSENFKKNHYSMNEGNESQYFIKNNIEYFLSESNEKNYFLDILNRCFHFFSKDLSIKRWFSVGEDVYFDRKSSGFWLIKYDMSCFKNLDQPEYDNRNIFLKDKWVYDSSTPNTLFKKEDKIERKINKIIKDKVNNWSIPDKESLFSLFNLKHAPFEIKKGRPAQFKKYIYKSLNGLHGVINDINYEAEGIKNAVVVPFLPCKLIFSSDNSSLKYLFIELLNCGFHVEKMKNNDDYKKLLEIFHRDNEHVPNNFPEEDFCEKSLGENLAEILLAEDEKRADITPYHKKTIEDLELGHWSLWQDELDTSSFYTIELSPKLVARDPKSSINDGVVAIDFGTKSTVIVYQKDTVNIHPMRIGTGNLSKDIDAIHYENPTILEFINLESFRSAYDAKANKPDTRWSDLTISHTAQNSMQGCESSKFNTFLDEIKQWAGDKNRKLKVVDQQGNIIDLPPFLELTADDFNPIEIYAYYLGLYINNLNNGIFMDYILSFPVTYELPIRDKIIESFEKGLKKSLPAELGKETIAELSVTKGASEPAAYALTALKEHKFDPGKDEHVFYSVFDFGGGTTDFDFGIFREATGRKERRFDYVIEHFGAGGDKFLGGENLLELLAFEVFKRNKSALLSAGIQFVKHPEKDAFAGSEQLINHSQEAKTNTKQLCIALRPFWEAHENFTFDNSGEISVTLTDIHGIQHAAFALSIDVEELESILSKRIERGVVNFFEALRLAFSHSKIPLVDINSVKIFLAGNSSQSCFVEELFKKHIALQHQEMALLEGESRFELFPPLGADKNEVEKPTGKTGVAFGLIESREGGRIKVIDQNIGENDIRFKFYLGENRKDKFKPIIDRQIAFNQWVEFTDAYYQKFEIFFTEQPSSSTGNISISDSSIKKKTIKLDMTDEDAYVYIRAVSPTKIEYVIGNENNIKNDIYLNEIQHIEL